ncbi:MAG: family 43 glycosylhydrolase, partial [Acidobacteriota bacterium]|nr:family 43 glycosylhydrolase [Acidobacteriota bacterium]
MTITPLAITSNEVFTNPIVESGADPWVIFWMNNYYYCCGSEDGISVSKSKKLKDIGTVPRVKVWIAPEGTNYSQNIWAPELHRLDGKWYIYFAADDGNNANHRMYVLERDNENPQGSY